jgi:hypothetical protein
MDFITKPGRARQLQDTIETIKAQYQLVLDSGVVSRLSKSQRDTGIKDPVAQPILERLQARWAELLAPDSNGKVLTRQQVIEILQEEFNSSTPEFRMNPLLRMRGV